MNNPTSLTDPLGLLRGLPGECDPFTNFSCPIPCHPFFDIGCDFPFPDPGPSPRPPGGGGGGGVGTGPVNSAFLTGDFGPLQPLTPWQIWGTGTAIQCDFGICSGVPANGIAGEEVLLEGAGAVLCPECAVALGIGIAAAELYAAYRIYQTKKTDIKQVRDAARQVSMEPGCRPPNPEDFNKVHAIIEHQKGPGGKVSYDVLLEAWREVLCK
jgi:hypothetical protein